MKSRVLLAAGTPEFGLGPLRITFEVLKETTMQNVV